MDSEAQKPIWPGQTTQEITQPHNFTTNLVSETGGQLVLGPNTKVPSKPYPFAREEEEAINYLLERNERIRRRREDKKKKELSQESEDAFMNADGKEILDSWWFFTSDWPPDNFDYGPILKYFKLRRVDLKDFPKESEFNKNANQKVFEHPSHGGLFINSQARVFDLRPKDCDTYRNLVKKTKTELIELYVDALAKRS